MSLRPGSYDDEDSGSALGACPRLRSAVIWGLGREECGLHLIVIPQWFNNLFYAGVTVVALWRGDARVRIVTVAQQGLLILSLSICTQSDCLHTPSHQLAELAIDGTLLAVCVACAARSSRYWTIAASSCALLYLATDVLAFVPSASLWAIASMSLIWSYLMNAALLWGALGGPRRSWIVERPA